ncbi:hypothetical protein HF576_12795 [Microbacterium sp. CFH 90308]|uniref:Uncharacterized protein n=1 Tax=Microbacterium salsuginis TaxID=2722803 RepID=A0ABX1KFF3_9MICO|nr:hypothetical protein [Microbacterium sp. CFH 90308]NLP84728.1 hypothetical protein [Microbacterium sp. CFH 90308]
MFGTDANVWSVEVEDWISGDGPERIEVVSPPENCGPNEPYFGSDPFEVALEHESSIVLLTGSEGGWQAITPLQGVVPAAPGGGIPEEW